MRDLFRFLTSRAGSFSAGSVTVTALVLAFFAARSFFVPMPKQWRLDFGGAEWIEPSSGSPIGYFRKDLYIPLPVDKAWIQIATTDEFDLYVNDVGVSSQASPTGMLFQLAGARVTGLYDIGNLLRPGKNVIAVHVNRTSFPGAAQILVRGLYAQSGSQTRGFLSDSSWKASATPDGIVQGYSWFAPEIDDTLWNDARGAKVGEWFSTVQPLPFDPSLIQDRPRGKWLSGSRTGAPETSFVFNLKLPLLRGETWLQIAASGSYDLLINGRPAVTQAVDPALLALSNPELAAPNAPTIARATSGTETGPTTDLPDLQAVTLSGQPPATSPFIALARPGIAVRTPARRPARNADLVPVPATAGYAPMPAPQLPPAAVSAASASPLGSFNSDPQQLVAFRPPPSLPPVVASPTVSLGLTGGVPALLAYNITWWLGAGTNTIAIHVRSDVGFPALLAEGFTRTASGEIRRFRTDGTWRTISFVPGEQSRQAEGAIVIGDYGVAPWGVLPQAIAPDPVAPGADLYTVLMWAEAIVPVAGGVLALWMLAGWLAASITGRSIQQVWNDDAVLHLPLLALMLLLWLLCYDIRFCSDWCFGPRVFSGLLLGLLLSKFLLFYPGPALPMSGSRTSRATPAIPRLWKIAVLAGITLLGLALRVHYLTSTSIDWDETFVIDSSGGILKAGYPFFHAGSYIRRASTYELICYLIALSRSLFGTHETTVRFHSLLLGTLTIPLIAYVGHRLFDWRVGLLAALIVALFPMSIWWSHSAFYPSTTQFLALATVWFFYEAIRTTPLQRRYVTLAAVTCVLTYFSWEGSGLILPALFLAIVVLKWGEFEWMTDWHLWRCSLLLATVILLQLAYREFVKPPNYLTIGIDLSDLTTPQLEYLDPTTYRPSYYLVFLLFQENLYVMTLLVLSGLAFAWWDRALRYILIVAFSMLAFLTELLPNYCGRYCYCVVALLILASAAICFKFCDQITKQNNSGTASWWSRPIKWGTALTLPLMLILSSNEFLLKSYKLSWSASTPQIGARLGNYWIDHRGTATFLAGHIRPEDAVVARIPNAMEFYSVKFNHTVSTMLAKKLFYDGGFAAPSYSDQYRGYPTARGIEDVEELRGRYARMWYVQAPLVNEHPAVESYLERYGKVVFESYGIRVILLEGPQNSTSN